MKSTGIVRRVDELGRIVIPIELRRILNVNEKDLMEVYVDNEKIILKKYSPQMTCQITGETSEDNITLANGNLVLSPEIAEKLAKEIETHLDN